MAAALLEEFGSGDARERAESWRYSRQALQALSQADFVPADARSTLAPALLARFDWPQTRGRRLVFVNGACSPLHSDAGALATEAARDGAATMLDLARDGETVHLVFASVPGARATRWDAALRTRIRARGVRFIEHHVGEAGADVLAAVRSQTQLEAGADASTLTVVDLPDSVSLYRHDDLRIAQDATHADLKALFGGRFQRHEAAVRLEGPRARHTARGVFALRGRQHVDAHLDVRHVARDAASDVLWRGVVDQRARGILHGAITVGAGADGAEARLETKNLLLSAYAEIDAQPVLEIHADEVKASHGATVGQIDERALFYLRSRGIPAAAARRLLIAGFCREALAGFEARDLREHIEALLDARGPGAAEAA